MKNLSRKFRYTFQSNHNIHLTKKVYLIYVYYFFLNCIFILHTLDNWTCPIKMCVQFFPIRYLYFLMRQKVMLESLRSVWRWNYQNQRIQKRFITAYIYGGTTYLYNQVTIPRLTLFGLGFPKWQHSIEHLIWKNSRQLCIYQM